MRTAAGNLVRFLADFDLSLEGLVPRQLAMLLAARNAAFLVEDLEVPMGEAAQAAGDATLVARTQRPQLEPMAQPRASLARDLPADTMDVGCARSIEDVPRIFPLQWLWEEVEPACFYTKLAQQELLLPRWRQVELMPEVAPSEAAPPQPVPQRAASQFSRQHAYLLLDTSSTMQDHDRRGTVARGLALAFLRKGYRDGAHLNLRPFASEVGELLSGYRREDFAAIVRRVITVPNAGQTRIQRALEQAVTDLQTAGSCRQAEIMLITDGISRLGRNPLAGQVLHTFILGDLFEEDDPDGTLQTLRRWSRTFRRIWTRRFAELLTPTWDDCRAAWAVLERLVHEYRTQKDRGPALARVRQNVCFLLNQFRRSQAGQSMAGELEAMAARLESVGYLLAEAEQPAAAVAGMADPSPTAIGPGFGGTPDAERGRAGAWAAGFGPFGHRRVWQWLRQWAHRLVASLKRLLALLAGRR